MHGPYVGKKPWARAFIITRERAKRPRNGPKNAVFELGWCQGSYLQNGPMGNPKKFSGLPAAGGMSHNKMGLGQPMVLYIKHGASHAQWGPHYRMTRLGSVNSR